MSFYNPVDIAVGDMILFTHEGRNSIKRLIKEQPELGSTDAFKIVEVVEMMAMDEHTEIKELTTGVVVLERVSTGQLFDIRDEYLDVKDQFWAFFTNKTPEFFVKTFNNVG